MIPKLTCPASRPFVGRPSGRPASNRPWPILTIDLFCNSFLQTKTCNNSPAFGILSIQANVIVRVENERLEPVKASLSTGIEKLSATAEFGGHHQTDRLRRRFQNSARSAVCESCEAFDRGLGGLRVRKRAKMKAALRTLQTLTIRESRFPVAFYVNYGPPPGGCLIQRLVELAGLRLSVVGIFALSIRMICESRKARVAAGRGPLQHL